jgi:hypothetical protein
MRARSRDVSTGAGLAQTTAGSEASFKIQIKEVYSNFETDLPVVGIGDKVAAVLVNTDNADLSPSVKNSRTANGTVHYTAQYTATWSGTYALTISLNSIVIGAGKSTSMAPRCARLSHSFPLIPSAEHLQRLYTVILTGACLCSQANPPR